MRRLFPVATLCCPPLAARRPLPMPSRPPPARAAQQPDSPTIHASTHWSSFWRDLERERGRGRCRRGALPACSSQDAHTWVVLPGRTGVLLVSKVWASLRPRPPPTWRLPTDAGDGRFQAMPYPPRRRPAIHNAQRALIFCTGREGKGRGWRGGGKTRRAAWSAPLAAPQQPLLLPVRTPLPNVRDFKQQVPIAPTPFQSSSAVAASTVDPPRTTGCRPGIVGPRKLRRGRSLSARRVVADVPRFRTRRTSRPTGLEAESTAADVKQRATGATRRGCCATVARPPGDVPPAPRPTCACARA
eukprot:364759-Chlamydomonas_euryale.AAC.11